MIAGHLITLGLQRTVRWKEVIRLLGQDGSLSEIADAAFLAARTGLERVAADQAFTLALANIFRFTESVRSSEFIEGLRERGFTASSDAGFLELICSLRTKTDIDMTAGRARSDVGEIAQNSFSEVLSRAVSNETASLFEAGPDTERRAMRQALSGKRFQGLMHEFFSVFTRRYLSYHLSRELPNHVGRSLRFETVDAQREFDRAFDTYIRQTVRIADEFTPGWFGKAQFEKRLSHESVSAFAHVAFKKIRGEFERGR